LPPTRQVARDGAHDDEIELELTLGFHQVTRVVRSPPARPGYSCMSTESRRNTTPQGRGAPGTILAARLLEIRAGQRRRLASLCTPARQNGLARALGTLFPPNQFQVRQFCLAYSSALVSPITLDPAPPEFHLPLSLWPPVILWRQLPTWRSSFSRHRLPYSSRSLTVSTAPPLKLVRLVRQRAAVGT
jgi:hypothetical protein